MNLWGAFISVLKAMSAKNISISWTKAFRSTGYTKRDDLMFITVTRTNKTPDSAFGNLMADLSPFKCVTLENALTLIPANVVYDVLFMWSNDFQQIMPHVIVPGRSAIELHWANYVVDPDNAAHIELKGCTALGTAAEPAADCIDESKSAWVSFVQQVLTDQPSVKIIYKEDYGPSVNV